MASKTSVVLKYINSQVSDVFSGWSLLLDPFQSDISNLMSLNELGKDHKKVKIAYRLSHAFKTNASSFSFGVVQWDLSAFKPIGGLDNTKITLDSGTTFVAHENSLAVRMLEQILRNATDAQGAYIFGSTKKENDARVDDIIEKNLGIEGQNSTFQRVRVLGDVVIDKTTGAKSLPLLDKINQALNSTYGQFWVDLWHSQYIEDLNDYVNTIINGVADPTDKLFLQSNKIAKLFITDVRNQFGVKFKNTTGNSLLNSNRNEDVRDFLNGKAVIPIWRSGKSGKATIQKVNVLGIDDIAHLYFSLARNGDRAFNVGGPKR